jgi:GGDEF domain-containing protein
MVSAIAYGYNKKENCVHAAGDAILELSRKDPLTGVYNKNEFLRQTYRMLTADYSISYTMGWLGVTNMRAINDLESFAEGDALLKKVAGALPPRTPEEQHFLPLWGHRLCLLFPDRGRETAGADHPEDPPLRPEDQRPSGASCFAWLLQDGRQGHLGD